MPLLLFKLESTKSEPNAKGRLARLWINSDSALPLGGVARSAENRNDYDRSLLRLRNRRRREIDELTRGEFLNEDPDIRTDILHIHRLRRLQRLVKREDPVATALGTDLIGSSCVRDDSHRV